MHEKTKRKTASGRKDLLELMVSEISVCHGGENSAEQTWSPHAGQEPSGGGRKRWLSELMHLSCNPDSEL